MKKKINKKSPVKCARNGERNGNVHTCAKHIFNNNLIYLIAPRRDAIIYLKRYIVIVAHDVHTLNISLAIFPIDYQSALHESHSRRVHENIVGKKPKSIHFDCMVRLHRRERRRQRRR